MNITTDQIPDEVVEAAVEAIRAEELRALGGYKTPDNGARRNAVRLALAAALPVLLGEPVAWTEKDGDEWVVYDANSKVGQHILHYQKDRHFTGVFPIFSFATPETPNAHP